MKRILEPELMEDEAQARAYAEADFEEAHARFIALFRQRFADLDINGHVLDLGCGPGDITIRFARAYPRCTLHGIDGSAAMLRYGRERLAACPDLHLRVELHLGRLPESAPPRGRYDAVISNSLLHHLPDPRVLWGCVKAYAAPGASVFVMDLKRPVNRRQAHALVEQYAAGEPEILRRDFFNSLLAAFEVHEVAAQLAESGLDGLTVSPVSDPHLAVAGIMGRRFPSFVGGVIRRGRPENCGRTRHTRPQNDRTPRNTSAPAAKTSEPEFAGNAGQRLGKPLRPARPEIAPPPER